MKKEKKAYAVFRLMPDGRWKKATFTFFSKEGARSAFVRLWFLFPEERFKVQEVDSWLLKIFG